MDGGGAVQFLQRFEPNAKILIDTPDRVDTMRYSEFEEYSQTNQSMDGKQSRGIHLDPVVPLCENRDGEDGIK